MREGRGPHDFFYGEGVLPTIVNMTHSLTLHPSTLREPHIVAVPYDRVNVERHQMLFGPAGSVPDGFVTMVNLTPGECACVSYFELSATLPTAGSCNANSATWRYSCSCKKKEKAKSLQPWSAY